MKILLNIIILLSALLFATARADDYTDILELQQSKDYKEARIKLQQMLQQDPNDTRTLLLLANNFKFTGQINEAITLYQQIITAKPEQPEAYNNLGMLYHEKGETEQAIELLLKTFETNPAYKTAYDNLREIYESLAAKAYSEALDIKHTQSTLNLAMVNDLSILEPQVVELIKEVRIEVPVEVIKEVPVEVPVEVIKEVPVEVPVEVIKEVRVEVPVEVIKEVPVEVPVEIIKEVPVEVPVEVVKEVRVEVPVEVIKEVPVEVIKEVEKKPEFDLSTEKKAVARVIHSWIADWASQNVEGYLSYYHPEYRSTDNLSLERWKSLRRERIVKPSYIKIKTGELGIGFVDEQTALVFFKQDYSASNYKDVTVKQVKLVKLEGSWLILEEETI